MKPVRTSPRRPPQVSQPTDTAVTDQSLFLQLSIFGQKRILTSPVFMLTDQCFTEHALELEKTRFSFGSFFYCLRLT